MEDLVAEARARGVDLYVQGAELRYRGPRGALDPELRAALRARRAELLELLERAKPGRARLETQRVVGSGSAAELLDLFLGDASIPVAIFRSRALGRDFVSARDSTVLEALAENGRPLPVLTFADCEKLRGFGARELAVILDVRAAFGPAAELVAVRPRVG